MICREIRLERYGWSVMCFIGYTAADAMYLCQHLVKIGCRGDALKEAYNHLLEDGNERGLTYSNINERISVVAIGESHDRANMVNTIGHELLHVVAHISSTDDIDMQGEEPCYVIGELCEKIFKLM